MRDHVDLAADVAAELGAVGVRLDTELAHRLHAERGAGGAAGRAVGEVVEQRAVEQVDVRARILPVHAHRQSVRDDRSVVPIRERRHPGLQRHQVGVVAPVDRNLLDRPAIDEVAELELRVLTSACEPVTVTASAAPTCSVSVKDDVFGHSQTDSRADDGPEAGQLRPKSVLTGRKAGEREPPMRVEVAVLASPVSVWVAVTSTPGSRAPVASTVCPTTVAEVWATPHRRHHQSCEQDHDETPTKHHGHSLTAPMPFEDSRRLPKATSGFGHLT